jgi:transcriptional regulator with XRE-family HTH domain
VPFNKGLKLLRNKRNLTVRDVEKASRRIAEAKGDDRFRISNGWLAQLEHGVSMPNPCTIFSLCATYRVPFAEILRLYGVNIEELPAYQHIADPNLTQLVPETNTLDESPGLMLIDTIASPGTSLITEPPSSNNKQTLNTHIRYGYIGLKDDTMYPLIRPGAVVEIDTRQTKVPPRSTSSPNEFEKPIFFVELRNGWTFGWCEIQGKKLVVRAHPLSRAPQHSEFDYPRDAEIVGRVVSYSTRCVDHDHDHDQKLTK